MRIRVPDDFHVHLRSGQMLTDVLPFTTRQFARALVMPNVPPILNAADVTRYRQEICALAPGSFQPLMAFKITPNTTTETIFDAHAAGAIAGKVYPLDITTGSEDGCAEIRDLFPCFDLLDQLGMVLSLHGEVPGVDDIDAETEFLPTLREIASAFPRLRIVLEHITTAEAVRVVESLPYTVAATITVHHLYLTMNDVHHGKLHPHNFCMPTAKRKRDRDALRAAATGGNPKFFLGTDTAPHEVNKKECADGCAGVFSAPVAIPLLVQLFDEMGVLDRRWEFASGFGARHYGLPLNDGTIELVAEPWVIQERYGIVVPF